MEYIVHQRCVIFRGAGYVSKPQAHRKLIAWDGVHTREHDHAMMVDLRRGSEQYARRAVVNKLNQEQRQRSAAASAAMSPSSS